MRLRVFSCSLRSARHSYLQDWWRVVADDVPVAFPGQPEGEASNGTLRATAPAGDCSRRLPQSPDRARLGEGCQWRSHGSFSRAIYRTALSLFSEGAWLRTTNVILWIRTAVRRF